jgi:hypothetical protein
MQDDLSGNRQWNPLRKTGLVRPPARSKPGEEPGFRKVPSGIGINQSDAAGTRCLCDWANEDDGLFGLYAITRRYTRYSTPCCAPLLGSPQVYQSPICSCDRSCYDSSKACMGKCAISGWFRIEAFAHAADFPPRRAAF